MLAPCFYSEGRERERALGLYKPCTAQNRIFQNGVGALHSVHGGICTSHKQVGLNEFGLNFRKHQKSFWGGVLNGPVLLTGGNSQCHFFCFISDAITEANQHGQPPPPYPGANHQVSSCGPVHDDAYHYRLLHQIIHCILCVFWVINGDRFIKASLECLCYWGDVMWSDHHVDLMIETICSQRDRNLHHDEDIRTWSWWLWDQLAVMMNHYYV